MMKVGLETLVQAQGMLVSGPGTLGKLHGLPGPQFPRL